jgi:hypothetical protein
MTGQSNQRQAIDGSPQPPPTAQSKTPGSFLPGVCQIVIR